MKIFMKSSFQCSPLTRRRTPLSLAEAYRFSENGKVPIKSRGLNRQVAGEIVYFLSVYRPVPSLYLSYERTAFFEKCGDLRISFDSGILSRRDDLFRRVRLARPRGRGSGRGADYVFYSSPELSKDGTYVFSINGAVRAHDFGKLFIKPFPVRRQTREREMRRKTIRTITQLTPAPM